MRSTQKDVVMEQRADIKQVLMGLGIPVSSLGKGKGHGINVTMIGPISVTYENGSREQGAGIIEIDGVDVTALPAAEPGPVLLRGVSTDVPSIDEEAIREFETIYDKLPENKLDATVRMVTEVAHRRDRSPHSVAKALNCSVYKARSVMAKFGLSS